MPVLDKAILSKYAWKNTLQSVALLTIMAGFLALAAEMLWGLTVFQLVIFSGLMIIYFSSFSLPSHALMKLHGAYAANVYEHPKIYSLLRRIADKANLSVTPKLYIVPGQQIDAFTVGAQNDSAIAVSQGLLRLLSFQELAGVLAHEVSHIKNNDIHVKGLAKFLTNLTQTLAVVGVVFVLLLLPLAFIYEITINWLGVLLLGVAPVLSSLSQLALSRAREYDADLSAAILLGNADGLLSALQKMDAYERKLAYRLLPSVKLKSGSSLFKTHPPTAERINRLSALSERENGLLMGAPTQDVLSSIALQAQDWKSVLLSDSIKLSNRPAYRVFYLR